MNNANRAALNTIINYIQLGLNLVISLFTVRLVLRSLGEVDYGIYNLIAGVVTIISFVSESLSQTSIRFISVSLGGGEAQHVRSIFSSCFSMHLYMAVLMTVILELVGLFLFDGFLNIPMQRIVAAKVVYHCMIATLFAGILSTPFRAILIAHEKFSYIAILGIFESILKLLVAICVFYLFADKLVLYGVLMSIVGYTLLLCFVIMSWMRFNRYVSFHLSRISEIRHIVQFAGWTLLDVFGTIANRQGYAIMLNKFYGPSTNAVFALAQHVESPLFSMSASAISAIRPQIMKSYGEGDIDRTIRLSFSAGKLGFSLMALLAIPIFVMLPEVLSLWLGEYPAGTVFFARMMIIACMVNQLSLGLATANQAFGRIKWFSIIVSTVRMSALPISILLLILGGTAKLAMIVYMACESFASASRVLVMSRIAGINVWSFIKEVVLRVSPATVIAGIFSTVFDSLFAGTWAMLANLCLTALLYSFCLYFTGLSDSERRNVLDIADNLIKHI